MYVCMYVYTHTHTGVHMYVLSPPQESMLHEDMDFCPCFNRARHKSSHSLNVD